MIIAIALSLSISLVTSAAPEKVVHSGVHATDAVAEAAATQENVTALERQSWVAWQGHDRDFFARVLADDHVDVGTRGVADKASVIAGVVSPACTVKSYALGDLKFTRLTADSAMIVYRAQQDTTCGSVRVPSPTWVTSVYVNRKGQWLNTSFQQTPIESP